MLKGVFLQLIFLDNLLRDDFDQISVDGERHPPKNFIDSTMLTVAAKITQIVSAVISYHHIVIIFIVI